MKLIFSDYDGTWDIHPELRGETQAIVTGRSYEEAQDLFDNYEGPKKPIFFNPKPLDQVDLLSIVNHKAEIINKSGATDFYEDMPNEASMLKLLCPKAKIHLVKDGETAI